MRHPSLTRFLTLCIALISVSMLVSGFYGLRSEAKDRRKAEKKLTALQENTDKYRQVLAELEGRDDYDTLEKNRKSRQKEYDSAAAKHRTELAAFTATRGGLKSGKQMLDEAESALNTAKKQYEEGLQTFEIQAMAFEDIYDQAMEAKALLEFVLPFLDTARRTVEGLEMLQTALENIDEILEGDTDDAEAMRLTALEAYDTAIALCTDAISSMETLQSLKDTEIPVEQLMDLLDSAGITLPDEIREMMEGAGEFLELLPKEELEAVGTAIEENIGMRLDELLLKMQTERAVIASGNWDEPLTEAQFETISQAYLDNREALRRLAEVYGSWLPELETMLENTALQLQSAYSALGQLETARLAIEQGRAALAAAGLQIEMSEQELKEGREQLEKEEKKLDEQAEALEREKRRLDEEEQALLILTQRCEEQKRLEEREKNLRLSLLAEKELSRERADGEKLLSAAVQLTELRREQIRLEFMRRFPASLLMIAGSVFAWMGVPAVFREKPSRGLLIASTLCCALLSGAVLLLLRRAGRGISYSALTTGALAVMTFLTALPPAKKA
ncbi:MAG: hypothetical protein K6C12_04905 [Oscillospiraceae bacterium]|nr:hypothetical protein [Oscillospiraceae bacterium]